MVIIDAQNEYRDTGKVPLHGIDLAVDNCAKVNTLFPHEGI